MFDINEDLLVNRRANVKEQDIGLSTVGVRSELMKALYESTCKKLKNVTVNKYTQNQANNSTEPTRSEESTIGQKVDFSQHYVTSWSYA